MYLVRPYFLIGLSHKCGGFHKNSWKYNHSNLLFPLNSIRHIVTPGSIYPSRSIYPSGSIYLSRSIYPSRIHIPLWIHISLKIHIPLPVLVNCNSFYLRIKRNVQTTRQIKMQHSKTNTMYTSSFEMSNLCKTNVQHQLNSIQKMNQKPLLLYLLTQACPDIGISILISVNLKLRFQ